MLTHVHAADNAAVLAVIDPDAYGVSTEVSDWVDASQFHQILAIVMAGTLGSSATIDGKIRQATSAAGAGAKDIAGAAITQMTKSAGDDKQALISLNTDALDIAGGFRYVALSMTIGGAPADAGGLIVGLAPRVGPASDNDLASVDEIVRV